MTANADIVATVGENPWWVGTGAQEGAQHIAMGDENVTSEEMLVRGKQDWEVELSTLVTTHRTGEVYPPRVTVTVPNRKAVVRTDTGAVLGIVSNRYEAVQNRDAFKFFDSVVGEGQAIYHTAGSLGAGERAWILAKLPETALIGGKDEVENYLLLMNGHDGNSAFRFFQTTIRVVCSNTFRFAEASADGGLKLSHYRQINRKLNAEDAREAVGAAQRMFLDFQETAERLAQSPTSAAEIEGVLQRLFPLPTTLLLEAPASNPLLLPEPKREDIAPEFNIIFKKRDTVRTLINQGVGNTGETRWDVLNGVSEYTDYFQGHRRLRAQNLLFGNGQQMKQQTLKLLRKVHLADPD